MVMFSCMGLKLHHTNEKLTQVIVWSIGQEPQASDIRTQGLSDENYAVMFIEQRPVAW